MGHETKTGGAQYCITVEGILDKSWAAWFDDMDVLLHRAGSGDPVTILSGPVPDQPALRGILSRIWDLNLTIISVVRIDEQVLEEERPDDCDRPIIRTPAG